MISASNATDAAVIEAFAKIPALLDQTPALIVRGRFLDCECLLGPINHAFHASIRQGRIVDLTPSPVLMRSWRFPFVPRSRHGRSIGSPHRARASTICWH